MDVEHLKEQHHAAVLYTRILLVRILGLALSSALFSLGSADTLEVETDLSFESSTRGR